jgi:ribonuclease G
LATHAESAESAESSDITSIAATGEMVSEPVIPVSAAEGHIDPTSPLHHESAVLSPELQTPSLQSFAPGSGALEEELIDEEEHEPATLHAYHEEEFDDLEEETLEGAADLGTMIREMSIDQITRPVDAEADEDEDDDFEEEESSETAEFGSDDTEDDEAEAGYAEGDKPAGQSAADAEFFANRFREPGSEESTASRTDSERRPRREGGRAIARAAPAASLIAAAPVMAAAVGSPCRRPTCPPSATC